MGNVQTTKIELLINMKTAKALGLMATQILTTCRRPVSAPPKPSCSHSTDMPGIFLLHGIFPGYVDEQGNNRYRCVWLLSQCFKQYRHRLLTARFDLGVLRLAHHSVNRRMDSNPATAGKI